MSKEISKPLQALYKTKGWSVPAYEEGYDVPFEETQEFNVIETALEETAELKKMIRNFNEAIGEPQIITPTIERQLKALEIIKEKFEIGVLHETCNNDLEVYQLCSSTARRYITKEEYELLREALL